MSTTDKRKGLRGGAQPAAEKSTEELAAEALEVVEESAAEEEEASAKDAPLVTSDRMWPFVVEEGGDWVFTLQYPCAPGSDPPPEKLRVRRTIYAKDVRKAGNAPEDMDSVFVLAECLTGVPTRILDRLDARDYSVLSTLVARISLGNSRAVLQSLGGRSPK